MIRRWLWLVVPPIVVAVLAILTWHVSLRAFHTPAWLVAPPSEVWQTIADSRSDLLAATARTAKSALLGFGASAVLGIAVAIVLTSARVIRNAIYPYTVFFQTVPVVAIAPMLLIWFGPGVQSVAICAFIVSVFPVIANTLAGLLATDPALRDLFRLYGAGPIATFWKLRLPAALPEIMTGLRIAAGLSVIGAIVGEFVAGEVDPPGLGIVIVSASKFSDTGMVFAAILAASLLGLAMLLSLNLISYLLLRRWHASVRK